MLKKTVTRKILKKRLGYSGEEMKKFLENTKNDELISKLPELVKKS